MTDSTSDKDEVSSLNSIATGGLTYPVDSLAFYKATCLHKYVKIHTNPDDCADETYFMCLVCGDMNDNK
jgi:hypothetical protein